MKFVMVQDLQVGMRLARPVYNRNGVLLFERDTKLSVTAINNIMNFGLLGIYILEPAEPLPPITEDDIDFERFQIMMVANLKDEFEKMIKTRKQKNMFNLTNLVIRRYAHVDGKVNFYQNLRSKNDYVLRHSLNVAILATMICYQMNVPYDDQERIVHSALVHDIGKIGLRNEAVFGAEVPVQVKHQMYTSAIQAMSIPEEAFALDGPAIKRFCTMALQSQMEFEDGLMGTGPGMAPNRKLLLGAKILIVANRYDELTAMNLRGESSSEVKAIRELLEYPEIYDKDVVNALLKSINILFPGVGVELNTGEKALVLTENKSNVLQPTILRFSDNQTIDLSLTVNRKIEVVDILKTLDNRYIMDTNIMKN